MSREIKFRIRNIVNGGVDYVSLEHLLTNDQSNISAKSVKDDFQISQYLNIKDKNNVELYDGDIFIHHGNIELCDFEGDIYQKLDCGLLEGDFEIIGNVWENPELLARKEQSK